MQPHYALALLVAQLSLTAASPAPIPATATFVTPATKPTTTDPEQSFAPGAITNVTCNGAANIVLADQQISELLVCNGIQAPINFCSGGLKTTTATKGTAKWTINAASGTTLSFFKGNWEECCNAARATCPGQSFTAVCLLGQANEGPGFQFQLSKA